MADRAHRAGPLLDPRAAPRELAVRVELLPLERALGAALHLVAVDVSARGLARLLVRNGFEIVDVLRQSLTAGDELEHLAARTVDGDLRLRVDGHASTLRCSRREFQVRTRHERPRGRAGHLRGRGEP